MFSVEKTDGVDAENEDAGEDVVGSRGRAGGWRTTELEHPMEAQAREHIAAEQFRVPPRRDTLAVSKFLRIQIDHWNLLAFPPVVLGVGPLWL